LSALNLTVTCFDAKKFQRYYAAQVLIIDYSFNFCIITTQVEITITIGTAILMKKNKKLCSYISAIFGINCDYNFNPCGICERMTSLTPFFNQDWNKEN